jgi:hypothetical protein
MGNTEPVGDTERLGDTARPEPTAPSTGWRFDLDFEDSVVALEHPPGLEKVAKAFEWFFEGLPHEDKEAVRGVLPAWHRLLEEHGPNYSLSTTSAGAIRQGPDTVELSSFFDHFEPVVISNTLFEEVVSAYQDFVEHDDRYK